MKHYCIVVLLLIAGMAGRAQNDQVERLAADFFNAVKHNDTTAFFRCFINNKDLYHIMYHYVRRQDSVSKDSISEVIMPEMSIMLAQQLSAMKQRFRDSGVNWASARYVNCFYNLLKDKSSVYPSLTGEMIFESNGKKYSIILGSAVYIADTWKLVNFRIGHAAVPAKPGVGYFLEKEGFFKGLAKTEKEMKPAAAAGSPIRLSSTPAMRKKPAVRKANN